MNRSLDNSWSMKSLFLNIWFHKGPEYIIDLIP